MFHSIKAVFWILLFILIIQGIPGASQVRAFREEKSGKQEVFPEKARNKLSLIRNYFCYYGDGNLDDFSEYDLCIIESENHTPSEISILKDKSLVIGYLSIGELDRHNLKYMGKSTSWQMVDKARGKVLENTVWQSTLADPDSRIWQEYIRVKARGIVKARGCDGFFLDTLGTGRRVPEKAPGIINLIRYLRVEYPECIIIVNRGFEMLPHLYDLIDGVMFENFTSDYDWEKKVYLINSEATLRYNDETFRKYLHPVKSAGGVVLALDYASFGDRDIIDKAWDRARQFGLIPLITGILLDSPESFTGNGKD